MCKVKSRNGYIKEEDNTYCELLRLACVSESENLNRLSTAQAVATLKQIGRYDQIHKRIIPLLSSKANSLKLLEKLPVNVQGLLQTETQQGVITELAKSQQLEQLINIFLSADIPIILLKGAAFSHVLYAEDAPRVSNDIDILVKTADWDVAVQAVKHVMDYTEKSRPDVFGDLYEFSFVPKSSVGAAVDLHKAISNPILFDVDEDDMWRTSVAHPKYCHKNVRMLSPEYALIHQAIHAYTDMNFCKYNIVDSHEIIHQLKPDMNMVISKAKPCGASLALFLLLESCVKHMGSVVEHSVMAKLKPHPVTQHISKKLVGSPHAHATAEKKSLRYRINQYLSMFVFTGSVIKPLYLNWLFIKLLTERKFKGMREV